MMHTEFIPSFTLTKTNRWILAMVICGLCTAALFGAHSGHSLFAIQQAGPQPALRDPQAIRGWMTVPYIAHVYHIPPEIIYRALQISPAGNNKKSLDELNRLCTPDSQGAIVNKVKQTVSDFNLHHPVPPQVLQ
jgi:hypothetical protein